jgi:hypothetical protein
MSLWDTFAEEAVPVHGCAGDSCQVCELHNIKAQLRPGTPAKHLSRSQGPATSKAAAQELPVTDLEALVLQTIRQAGPRGMTQDELLQQFPNLSYSSVTARPAALKRRGLIADSGEKRKGRSGRNQSVLIALEYVQSTL